MVLHPPGTRVAFFSECSYSIIIATYKYVSIMANSLSTSLPGVTFSLRGNSIPTDGSGRVRITDIRDTNANALVCRSGIPTTAGGNWYLHPTEMSTNDDDRIGSDGVYS